MSKLSNSERCVINQLLHREKHVTELVECSNRQLSMMTIYALITVLEELDLIEGREVEDPTTGAMRVRYRLTKRGREAQATWI